MSAPGSETFAAAEFGGGVRTLLVGWLTAWFVLVVGLLVWSLTGGGLGSFFLAVVLGILVPAGLLARLSTFPSTYVLEGNRLLVRRQLGNPLSYELRGPVETGAGTITLGRLERLKRLAGLAYGCRSAGDVRLALTDADHAVRVGTAQGALVVSPAESTRFVASVRDRLGSAATPAPAPAPQRFSPGTVGAGGAVGGGETAGTGDVPGGAGKPGGAGETAGTGDVPGGAGKPAGAGATVGAHDPAGAAPEGQPGTTPPPPPMPEMPWHRDGRSPRRPGSAGS